MPVFCCERWLADPAVTQSWCHRFSARQLRNGATSPIPSLTSPPTRSTRKFHVSWKSLTSLSGTSQCMKRSNLTAIKDNCYSLKWYPSPEMTLVVNKQFSFRKNTRGYFVPTTNFTTCASGVPVHLAIWLDRSSKDVLSVKENRKRTASTCSLQAWKIKRLVDVVRVFIWILPHVSIVPFLFQRNTMCFVETLFHTYRKQMVKSSQGVLSTVPQLQTEEKHSTILSQLHGPIDHRGFNTLKKAMEYLISLVFMLKSWQ